MAFRPAEASPGPDLEIFCGGREVPLGCRIFVGGLTAGLKEDRPCLFPVNQGYLTELACQGRGGRDIHVDRYINNRVLKYMHVLFFNKHVNLTKTFSIKATINEQAHHTQGSVCFSVANGLDVLLWFHHFFPCWLFYSACLA